MGRRASAKNAHTAGGTGQFHGDVGRGHAHLCIDPVGLPPEGHATVMPGLIITARPRRPMLRTTKDLSLLGSKSLHAHQGRPPCPP